MLRHKNWERWYLICYKWPPKQQQEYNLLDFLKIQNDLSLTHAGKYWIKSNWRKGEYSKTFSYVCIEFKYYKIKWNVHLHQLVNKHEFMKSFSKLWRPPSGHLHCIKQSFAVWPQEKTFEVILQCEQAYLLCCSLQLMLKTINQQSNQHCSELVCSGRSSELVHWNETS